MWERYIFAFWLFVLFIFLFLATRIPPVSLLKLLSIANYLFSFLVIFQLILFWTICFSRWLPISQVPLDIRVCSSFSSLFSSCWRFKLCFCYVVCLLIICTILFFRLISILEIFCFCFFASVLIVVAIVRICLTQLSFWYPWYLFLYTVSLRQASSLSAFTACLVVCWR